MTDNAPALMVNAHAYRFVRCVDETVPIFEASNDGETWYRMTTEVGSVRRLGIGYVFVRHLPAR